jgi:5-methylcytosine-specific restriction endonuclease McrBC regulatory subunit McrC
MMAFAHMYLHDDGAFLLIYPDSSSMKAKVAEFLKNYKLKIKDKWTIINCLYLAIDFTTYIHFLLSPGTIVVGM